MKRKTILSLLLLPAILIMSLPVFAAQGGERSVSSLLDTENHRAYISGLPDGSFNPEGSVTRAEAAQMLYSLLRDKSAGRKSFPDVGNAWYRDAVETMAYLGAVNGYSDGKFYPGNQMTRAEFAAACAALSGEQAKGSAGFSDVPAGHWAAPAIALCAEKGWISGYGNGLFGVNDPLTRAQAVTIINKMLGRSAPAGIRDAKQFSDVLPSQWYYSQVAEACTDHEYVISNGAEVWTSYEKQPPRPSGWVEIGGKQYYYDSAAGQYLRGEHLIDGSLRRFDESTGEALNGFAMKDGFRRYYVDGLLQEDISSTGEVRAPYFIKVYKPSNYLIVYSQDPGGNFNTPVKAMRVSCGVNTPVGTFYIPQKFRWLKMVGGTWAQWCSQISGNYLFHSVPNYTKSNANLEVEEFNRLGETRSLGCIRLNCGDAKWIYDNCPAGTKVEITNGETSGPLAKPEGITLPSWHTWDPTDPTASYLCKQYGCH